MRTDTRPIQITIADLQADAEDVLRSLPESSEAIIIVSAREVIVMLATVASSPPLMAERTAEVWQAFADAEKVDPSVWIGHEEFMHELDSDNCR